MILKFGMVLCESFLCRQKHAETVFAVQVTNDTATEATTNSSSRRLLAEQVSSFSNG